MEYHLLQYRLEVPEKGCKHSLSYNMHRLPTDLPSLDCDVTAIVLHSKEGTLQRSGSGREGFVLSIAQDH